MYKYDFTCKQSCFKVMNVGKSCYMVFTPEHGSMICARARTYDMNKESNLYLCGT